MSGGTFRPLLPVAAAASLGVVLWSITHAHPQPERPSLSEIQQPRMIAEYTVGRDSVFLFGGGPVICILVRQVPPTGAPAWKYFCWYGSLRVGEAP